MAAMVMLVIVLAAFLQVEGRLATTHSAYLRARMNAAVAGRLAEVIVLDVSMALALAWQNFSLKRGTGRYAFR